ncbi:MAG: O-antigen ligase family protein [Pseudomonadota bacterium]
MSAHDKPRPAETAVTERRSSPDTPRLALGGEATIGVGLLAGCAAMLAFAPLIHLPLALSEFDQKRFMQLMLLLVTAAAYALSRDLRHHVAAELSSLPRTGLVALGLVLTLGAASSAQAESPRHAFAEMALLLGLGLYAVTLAGALRPVLPAARHWFAIMVLAMMGLYLLRTAGAYVAWLTTIQLEINELLVGLGHKRFFGHWLTLTLPLSALPVLLLRSPWARAGALLVASLWWSIAYGSGGRGTFLGVGAAIAFTAMTVPKARAWCALQVLCALTGFALAFTLFELPTRGSDAVIGMERLSGQVGTAGANEGRVVLLLESAELILDHPLLGIGPMHFAAVGERGHPHNIVAQLAVEWGLPATAVLMALALAAAFAWWRLVPAARTAPIVRPAIGASLLAGAVHAMVSGLLIPAYTQLWLATLAGFALCEFNEMLSPYGRELDRRPEPRGQRARYSVPMTSATVAIAWLCCLVALGITTVRDAPLVLQSMRAMQARQVTGAPRFWQYGYVDDARSLRALVEHQPLRKRPRYTLEATLERVHLPFLPD